MKRACALGLPYVLGLSLLGLAVNAYAQFSASVQGSVQDQNGAVVPGASVTLVNVDTGITKRTVGNGSGVYRFESLAPGNYTVSAKAEGFSPILVSFNLTTGQTRDVPLAMTVGQVSSSVVVTTEAPLLDTSDSRFEQTLNTSALEDLPLASRNPISVMNVTPGVTGTGVVGQGSGALTFNPENFVTASANGQGQNGNQYIVDGMDVTSTIRPGILNLTPNADVVQEVSVQTNTYTTEYGRSASIQTVMTTKSGTNQFHGLASNYYTYQGLTARGEFGIPQPTPLAPYHSNNMSFALGGPIIRHKEFFFFVGYEPYLALASNGTGQVEYEDPGFLAFAQSAAPNSPELSLMTKFPVTTSAVAGSRVFATAQSLWDPNGQVCSGANNTLTLDQIAVPCSLPVYDEGNWNSSSYENAKQYNVRIDKNFKKDRLYGQVFRNTITEGGPSLRPAFANVTDDWEISFQANETHTFSPNMLNEAIFGYSRIQGTFGLDAKVYNVPYVQVLQGGTMWGNAEGSYIQHGYHWRDVLTRIVGSHSLKGGFEAWRSDDIALFAPAYGVPYFLFYDMIDLIADNPLEETDLSYNPVTGKPQDGNYGYKKTTFGIFAEDSWKASRKLTVNYGIRYDNFGNPYVALSSGTLANFHLAPGSTFGEQVANGRMTQQSHVFGSDMNYVFSPRAGIAYDPFGNGRWVIRAGAGLFHNEFTLGNAENGLSRNPPGFVVPTFYNNGSTAPPIFGYGTSNTYPYGFPMPAFVGSPLDAKGGITGSQIAVGGTSVNLSSPDTVNWSAGLQRQLGARLVASAGYSGSHSNNLVVGGGNTGNTSYGVDVNVFPGDLIQHPAFGPDGVWTGTGIQTRRNTSFGAITYAYNGARANYQAFIGAVQGRFASGGFLTASYTRSVSKDNWNNYPEGYVGGHGGAYNLEQWYSPSPWDAPNRVSVAASYDIPGMKNGNGFTRRLTSGFNLASTIVLQSGNPFFVYNANPMALIDTAGVTVTSDNYQSELASGHFAYAPGSGDYAGTGDYGATSMGSAGTSSGESVPDVLSYRQRRDRKAYQYTGTVDSGVISHSQFAAPAFSANGAEGNEKLGQFRLPGYADTDLTVRKTTALAERVNLELRLDIFNLFNRVNLDPSKFDSNVGDPSANFGTTNSNLPARFMQIAARITF